MGRRSRRDQLDPRSRISEHSGWWSEGEGEREGSRDWRQRTYTHRAIHVCRRKKSSRGGVEVT
eukprot:4523202-Pyramimonas_sp.AAC.1